MSSILKTSTICRNILKVNRLKKGLSKFDVQKIRGPISKKIVFYMHTRKKQRLNNEVRLNAFYKKEKKSSIRFQCHPFDVFRVTFIDDTTLCSFQNISIARIRSIYTFSPLEILE